MTRTHRAAEVRWTLQPAQLSAWLDACGVHAAPDAAAPPMAAVLATVPHVATPLLRELQHGGAVQPGTPLLHGDEQVVWHHDLKVGERYLTGGEIAAQAYSRAGLAVRLLARLHAADGALVVEAASALLFARHTGDADADARPVAAASANTGAAGPEVARWVVGLDQPERYAAASGDDNPLHLDDAAARRLGLRARPLHGMCTLAGAAHHLTSIVGPHVALRRLRARFRAPVHPGDTLVLHAAPARGAPGWRFLVRNGVGETVLARGAAEFARPGD